MSQWVTCSSVVLTCFYLWDLTNTQLFADTLTHPSYCIYPQSEDILKESHFKSSLWEDAWIWVKLEHPRAGECLWLPGCSVPHASGNAMRVKIRCMWKSQIRSAFSFPAAVFLLYSLVMYQEATLVFIGFRIMGWVFSFTCTFDDG